jgi:hypothetical protein
MRLARIVIKVGELFHCGFYGFLHQQLDFSFNDMLVD